MGAKGKGIIEKNYLVELEIDRLLMIYKTTGDNFSK
jgi:hypothetical protein